MDETLTSPTCNTQPVFLSVVIPAYNAAEDLAACLESLKSVHDLNYEIIVVNDSSTDATPEVAARYGVRLFSKRVKSGPASCRNWGVYEARGEWIYFIDADVTAQSDTISKAIAHIRKNPQTDALFGSYDDSPADPGCVSQFRNLLHHHVHQTGEFQANLRPASTFWTGCGFIRRSVFLELGGFDFWRYRKPAIEDIEFGYRMSVNQKRIVLARDVLCKHRKKWTLMSMIRTDFFQRGLPWSLLMFRSPHKSNDLNVDNRQKVAAISSALVWFGLFLAIFQPLAGLGLCGLMLGVMMILNLDFFRLLYRKGGTKLAFAGMALMHVYYIVCLTSYASALSIFVLTDRLNLIKSRESERPIPPSHHLSGQIGSDHQSDTRPSTKTRVSS